MRRPSRADGRLLPLSPTAAESQAAAEPARESAESVRARKLAEADRLRLEAARHTRDLPDPAQVVLSPEPARRAPAQPVGTTAAPAARVTQAPAARPPVVQEPEPAWPPTGARLAWPPSRPGQDRGTARQTPVNVSAPSFDTEAVLEPTPGPTVPHQPVPVLSASQAVLDSPDVTAAATSLPVPSPTVTGFPATGAGVPVPATTDDVTADPAAETADDVSALFADATTDHVAKPKKRQAHRHRARTFVVMTVVLAMVVGAGYVLVTSLHLFGRGSGISDYTGEGDVPVDVTVRKGDAGVAIARTLHAAEVVATEKAFVDACKASTDCQRIQPGTYSLKRHMSAAAALAALLNPDNLKSGKLTIVEGKTATEIVEQISTKTGIPVADLNAAIEAAKTDPATIGLPPEAGGNVEGWLYPSTYDVEPGATAVEVLKMMVGQTTDVLAGEGVPQSDWERVLTQASLVEKEGGINTATGEDYRPKVARVIQNRLAQDMPLGLDATTIYGNPDPSQSISDKNKDANNPYNTYVRPGLPPGPIASPSKVAIDAVLHPADGPWFYYVTINYDTRETRFAVTYTEHQANVQLFRDWYNQQKTASPAPGDQP